MEFQVLGRVGYRTESEWIRPRGMLRHRLLGLFLARAGRLVSYDTLAHTLWPDQQSPQERAKATGRVHLHVHRFRQALDRPERIVADRNGYLLQVEPEELDAARFEGLVEQAKAAGVQDPARAALARQALAQWSDPWDGRAYPDLDVPLISDEAARLQQVRDEAVEMLFDAEIRGGRHLDVLTDLTRVATANPVHEPLQVLLMQGLHQAGRPAEALEVYTRTRQHLVEELGLEPSEPLRRVQEFVLSGRSPVPEATAAAPAEHPQTVPAPSQLPAPVPLVGRHTALQEVGRALSAGACRQVLISGLPGVGKTSLAVAWASEHREHFPDGQLFVDLHGYGPTPEPPTGVVLDRLIRSLGGNPTGLRDTEERIATYRSRLAGRQVAVIVDNARSEDQVRPFLPGEPGCVALVTSRDQLTGLIAGDNVQHVPLSPLGQADALELLRRVSRNQPGAAPEEAADAPVADSVLEHLASRCGGLPVALRVAALRAEELSTDLLAPEASAEEVLDWLDLGDPVTSARTVFSWSVDALPPEVYLLFQALGVHVGSRIDLGGMAALTDTDQRTARRGVDHLVRANLAQRDQGWVRQHDLLAAYARERAADLPEAERDRMLHRLLRYYQRRVEAVDTMTKRGGEQEIFTDLAQANQWLDRAAEPMVAAVERAPEAADEEVISLSRHLNGALTGRGEFEVADRLQRHAVQVAERRGDLSAASAAMQALAAVTGKLGDAAASEEQWDRARHLAIASGDPIRLGVVHNNVANPLVMEGCYLRAWGHLSRALRLCEIGGDKARAQTVRSNLGFVLVGLERPDRAESILVDLLAEGPHPDARANALRTLALLELRRGRLPEAAEVISEAVDLARQTANYVMICELDSFLAQVRYRQGDPATAHELALRALNQAVEHREQIEIVQALIAVGRIESQEDPGLAMTRIEEALARARRERLREMEFRALYGLAEVYQQMGQEVRADAVRRLAGQVRLECGLPQTPSHEAW